MNVPLSNRCRHFAGGLKCLCDLNIPIKHMVRERMRNDYGLFHKLPCRPTAQKVLDCQHYEPKTADEIEADRKANIEAMDAFVLAMPKIEAIKKKMIADKTERDVVDCPYCGGKATFSVTCSIYVNKHLHACCSACDKGFME